MTPFANTEAFIREIAPDEVAAALADADYVLQSTLALSSDRLIVLQNMHSFLERLMLLLVGAANQERVDCDANPKRLTYKVRRLHAEAIVLRRDINRVK